jgi:L-ascorbate metabolism protein UlaG (beta-lactamase superfamily)
MRACYLALLLLLLFCAEGAAGLEVRWLGVAGFAISDGDAVLLHDPFLSRPGTLATFFSLYRPDEAVLGRLLAAGSPAPELAGADWIVIGHAHYDHLGDAPWLAQRTGALLVGSATATNVAQGYGLPAERTLAAAPGARFDAGPFEVRVVESRHAKVLFGRVPLEGEITSPPEAPIHALSFKLGDARDYLVTHRPSGLRVLTSSSAGHHPPALEALAAEGVRADLLLLATHGRDAGYAADLVRTLRPRIVVPCHFDDFRKGVDDPEAGAPSDPEDLAAFEAELGAAAAAEGIALEVRRLGLFEALTLAPPGG